MGSLALQDWTSVRRARIDELVEAHAAVGGSGPGRRWRTQQLNWAIILRLSAEFQGFVRDLHGEASGFVLVAVGAGSPPAAQLLRGALLRGRVIDHGNPNAKNLAKDFRRLGIEVWTSLQSRYARAARWKEELDLPMDARNAIAHDDESIVAKLARAGWKLDLGDARRWRTTLERLASALDAVVGDELETVFGAGPWG